MIDGTSIQVKIFADGADIQTMLEMCKKSYVKGLTTNPTLMRKAGVRDYKRFAEEVLAEIKDKPISFEVFSDNLDGMISQGLEIASWGDNVNVKIPVTNTKGLSTRPVIEYLSRRGVSLNITAIMTNEQVKSVAAAIHEDSKSYISIFAGRIADTGRDPIPILRQSLETLKKIPKVELIWASPRELLNVIQANEIGCHIITATIDILKKFELIGKDLEQFSLETVRMFRDDALSSGFTI